MPLIIFIFTAGCLLVAFGIRELKTKFSDRQFAKAKVIGYRKPPIVSARLGTSILISAAYSTAQIVNPVVEFKNKNGCTHSAPLHITVDKFSIAKSYPEFEVGGEVMVSFFGDSPRECFLENHPLQQNVLRTSVFLLAGIALLATTVLLTVYYISI